MRAFHPNNAMSDEKPSHEIIEYKHKLLSSKRPIMIHTDFKVSMDMFCRYLEICKCTFYVTSSGRLDTHVPGAIVKPANHGCHLVFCAIDGNIIDSKGVWWNSTKINTEGLSGDAQNFVALIRRSKVLRYGGDFKTPDSVHYDNDLYRKNPDRWNEIYTYIHTIYKNQIS